MERPELVLLRKCPQWYDKVTPMCHCVIVLELVEFWKYELKDVQFFVSQELVLTTHAELPYYMIYLKQIGHCKAASLSGSDFIILQ